MSTQKKYEKCRSCAESVIWAKNVHTRGWAPIDVESSPEGNCIFTAKAEYEVILPKDPRWEQSTRHMNHFVTCRQQKMWRARVKNPAQKRLM